LTGATALTMPRVGTRALGSASGSVSQRSVASGAFSKMPRLAYEKRQYSRSTGALEAGTELKSMLASYRPQL